MTIVLPLRTRRVRRQRAPTAAPPSPDAVPRVARMVALAHRWRDLIRTGVVKDQAALATLVGVSRARITQVMGLLYLAPDIQEELVFLDVRLRGDVLHRTLLPLAAEPHWVAQRAKWREMRAMGRRGPAPGTDA